jgi:hypothetical protein
MRFPDRSAVLKLGVASPAAPFHQLKNTVILIGHSSGSQDNVMIIDYVTRKDIRKAGGPRDLGRAPAAQDQPA